MTSFYEQTTGGARRVHDSLSHEFTVTQYTWDNTGGSNAYADGGDWTESSSTASGTIEFPDSATTTTGPDGDTVEIAATIYVQPDDVDVNLGVEDETRSTEFTDSKTGRQYEAVNVRDQTSLLAVDCTSI
jgi:hypothetical protein